MERFDIAIVGAGPVGASLALALADHWRVALIDRAAPPLASLADDDWDNRIYAVSPASLAFLQRLGAWPMARAGQIREMDVRGDAGGVLRFDALELGRDCLAATVENRLMQATLWTALQGRVSCFAPAALQRINWMEPCAELVFEEGKAVQAALLIGADGAQSWLRTQTGIGFDRKPYGQSGVVANFHCERPHLGVARQWFRDDGILAWLPLPGNRVSMVWSTTPSHAAELLDMAPEALANMVAAAGGQAWGRFTPLTPAAAFPLSLGRARSMIGPRLALVGDAAHTVHPLAGQGVNLGFGDAAKLAELLLASPSRDPGDAMLLSRYARHRAEPVLTMQTLCDGLHALFSHQHTLLAPVRNLGMSLTNRAGPLKRALMRQAIS